MVVNIGTWCPRMAAVMSLRFNVTFHPPRHALCREGHMLLRNPRAWLICEHTRIRGETPVIPRDLSDSASKLGSRIMISWFKSTCIMLPREDKGLRELLQSTWRLPHHFWILEVWWCTSLYHILHKYIYIYTHTIPIHFVCCSHSARSRPLLCMRLDSRCPLCWPCQVASQRPKGCRHFCGSGTDWLCMYGRSLWHPLPLGKTAW